jgi:hypothetical protein
MRTAFKVGRFLNISDCNGSYHGFLDRDLMLIKEVTETRIISEAITYLKVLRLPLWLGKPLQNMTTYMFRLPHSGPFLLHALSPVCVNIKRTGPTRGDHGLLTLPDHLSSWLVFCRVCVAQFSVFCDCVDHCLSFVPFYLVIVLSAIYVFWLSL